MVEIRLPKVNVNEDTATVVAWVADDGSSVSPGDVVCTIETNKATVDLEAEAAGYLRHRARRLQWHRGAWGPRFSGMDQARADRSLIEVCGLQWQVCVQSAAGALRHLPPGQVVTVAYEDLVNDPLHVTSEVFDAVQLSFAPECRAYVESEIDRGYVDAWRKRLSDEDLALLLPVIESELRDCGYVP